MFAPDVQGPMAKRTAELILAAKPRLDYAGWTAAVSWAASAWKCAQLEQGIANLESIVEAVPTGGFGASCVAGRVLAPKDGASLSRKPPRKGTPSRQPQSTLGQKTVFLNQNVNNSTATSRHQKNSSSGQKRLATKKSLNHPSERFLFA